MKKNKTPITVETGPLQIFGYDVIEELIEFYTSYDNEKDYVLIDESFRKVYKEIADKNIIIYPGSFNPITTAHKYMISSIKSNKYIFPLPSQLIVEISICRDEKSDYSLPELMNIINQFYGLGVRLLITKKSLIHEKIKIIKSIWKYKNIRILCGLDTAERILDYYKDLTDWKTSFIINPRKTSRYSIRDSIENECNNLLNFFPEETIILPYVEGIVNISSTTIRKNSKTGM